MSGDEGKSPAPTSQTFAHSHRPSRPPPPPTKFLFYIYQTKVNSILPLNKNVSISNPIKMLFLAAVIPVSVLF